MKSKKTILVADDDLPILEVMKIILSSDGFNVVIASNGGTIEKMINETHPDLVMMDIWMSGFDGREIAQKLKASEQTKKIPIIIISALGNTKEIAAKAGADDFLEKPFEIENLLKLAKKYT